MWNLAFYWMTLCYPSWYVVDAFHSLRGLRCNAKWTNVNPNCCFVSSNTPFVFQHFIVQSRSSSSERRGGGDRLTWTDFMESTRPVQPTMNATPGSVTCRCGKVCKNQLGLRIHQAMSGCQRVRSREQRIASMARETQYWGTLRPGNKHRMPVRILKWMTTPPTATPNPERERERAVQKQSNWHVQIDDVKPLTMNLETKD